MKHWKVTGTVHTCPDCLRPYRFLIYDERGRPYGCRETHAAAMTLARKKARKRADYYDSVYSDARFPLAA